MFADEVDYVVGVDTHRDQHELAGVVAPTGAVVARRAVPANARVYAQALRVANEYASGAARAALGHELGSPRAGQRREALRLLLVARRSAVDVRREALVQLRSVIVTS